MPLYEYQCADCAKLTDVRHGFKEVHSEPCPACGGELKRRFTPTTGIVFKGSGFYVTDSRKSRERAGKAADPGATSEQAVAKDGTKSEDGSPAPASAKTDAPPKSDSAAPKAAPQPSTDSGIKSAKKDAAA